MNYLLKRENNRLAKPNRKKKKNFLGIILILASLFLFLFAFLLNKSSKSFDFISPQVGVNLAESLKKEMIILGIEIKGMPIIDGNEVMATLSSGTIVYFKKNGSEDYSKILASLQLILENIKIEGRWPLKIDLRFKRPVLSF